MMGTEHPEASIIECTRIIAFTRSYLSSVLVIEVPLCAFIKSSVVAPPCRDRSSDAEWIAISFLSFPSSLSVICVKLLPRLYTSRPSPFSHMYLSRITVARCSQSCLIHVTSHSLMHSVRHSMVCIVCVVRCASVS